MNALARVSVLEQMRAIEVGQPMPIGRKVRRNPIQDHADAMLMQVIDQIHEILRRTVTRSGREVTRCLISPRAKERMLHHR